MIRDILTAAFCVACCLVVLWLVPDEPTSQREAFLRERIKYLEETLAMERRSRAEAVVRDTMEALGVRP